MDELLLMDEQRKWFLEMESSTSKDTVKMVQRTTRDLEYYINLIDKQQQGLRANSNFERNSVGKNAIKQHHMLQKGHS